MTDLPPSGVTDQHASAGRRLAAALGVGVVAGVVASAIAPWQTVPLLAWDAAAVTWLLAVWTGLIHLDPIATSAHATAEDPSRAVSDLLLLSASVISLVGVVLGILKAANTHGNMKALLVAAGIFTVVVSWAAVQTRFTLRYAHLFYLGADGGIDFNDGGKPSYLDFAYLAFTVGMTYQVSDTSLTSKEMRRAALSHALLSYLFGTVIIASAINVAAGLAR